MTLLVKDANTTTQSISTQIDVQRNLVQVNCPAAVQNNVAVPVSTSAPLPVINTAPVSVDGAARRHPPEAVLAVVWPGNPRDNSRVRSYGFSLPSLGSREE